MTDRATQPDVDREAAVKRSSERHAERVAWAEKNLPNEHAPFVASAIGTLALLKVRPTKEAVLERLREQGKLMGQMEEPTQEKSA